MIAYISVTMLGSSIPLYHKVKTNYCSMSELMGAIANLIEDGIESLNKYLQAPQYSVEFITINEIQITHRQKDFSIGSNPHYFVTIKPKAFDGESTLHINAGNDVLKHVGLMIEPTWNDQGMNDIIDIVTHTKVGQIGIIGSVDAFKGAVVRWLCNQKINEGVINGRKA